MPTSRTMMALRFKAFKSALKIEESEAEMEAVRVERVIGRAFAARLRMFLKNDWAVQSSGSVRTTAIFAVFGFWLCILAFIKVLSN